MFIQLFRGRGDKQILVRNEKILKEGKMFIFKKTIFHSENELEQRFSASQLSETDSKYCIKEKNIIFSSSSTMPLLTLPQSLRNSQPQQGESSVLCTVLFGVLHPNISWDCVPVCMFFRTEGLS